MMLLELGLPRCYDCDKPKLPQGEYIVPDSLESNFCHCIGSIMWRTITSLQGLQPDPGDIEPISGPYFNAKEAMATIITENYPWISLREIEQISESAIIDRLVTMLLGTGYFWGELEGRMGIWPINPRLSEN